MGYMVKSVVMQAIEEDMKDALHVYSDKQSKDIVKFCYESVAREIDKLPQYRMDNVCDMDNWILCSENLPEDFQRVLATVIHFEQPLMMYLDDGQWHEEGSEAKCLNRNVIAWQPLPQRYKERE